MNEPIVVDGIIVNYRLTADGALRINIDLDEIQTRKFHQLFNPAYGVKVAVARIDYEPFVAG